MKRVAIIGSGGAGKSTLARQVGDATGLPVIHLDREYWQPGWVAPENEAWAARVAELVAGEAWIIDGNYGGTMEARFARADTIVLLDIPRTVCLYRAVKRTVLFRNRSRPDMAPGCEEKIDLEFLKWIWAYPATRRPGILARLREERAAGKRVVRLRNTKQVRTFLRTLAASTADERAVDA